jgi:hypothetical protein
MKYLHDSQETKACIYPLKNRMIIICCWFFFYARGTLLQKSFEGLLHSILYQIVLENDQLAYMILPIFGEFRKSDRSLPVDTNQRGSYPLEVLQNAFNRILHQDVFHLRLYLFLDALDEYAGRPELVAEFLQAASNPRAGSLTQVKICFSSRPSNVFVRHFDTYPGFSIHDYTMDDIWDYTKSQLTMQYINSKDVEMLQVGRLQLEIGQLTQAVVEKARGVFLWVRLVMKDFLQRSTDGASLHELREVLKSIPEELEDFYNTIIQKIPTDYRVEAYNMLEVVLRSDKFLGLGEYIGAIACATCETLGECRGRLNVETSQSARISLARKLQSRCGGLLEIVQATPIDPDIAVDLPTVQFMHETVREVVSKPGFRQSILGNGALSSGQNGHSILAKYYLSTATNSIVAISQGMHHARLSEATTGLDQAEFLDSVDADTFNLWREVGLAYSPFCPNTVISLAVVADLRLYVTKELKRKPLWVNMHPEMSLLHTAVNHTSLNQDQSSPGLKVNPHHSLGPMCEILLKCGVSLHSEYQGCTPFQSILIVNPADAKMALKMIKVFLEAGQDPNIDLYSSPGSLDLVWKPLHRPWPELSSLLLEHNAMTDALDSSGATPLDRYLVHFVQQKSIYDSYRQVDKDLEMILTLIEHGGRITRMALRYFPLVLRRLEKFYAVPKELRDIRSLLLPGTEDSVRDQDIHLLPSNLSTDLTTDFGPRRSLGSQPGRVPPAPEVFELDGVPLIQLQPTGALGRLYKLFMRSE